MKKFIILIAFCFFILATGISHAQWVQTSGPFGGYINCLAINGSDIYAGAQGGMSLSTDYGKSWKQINNGIYNPQIISIVASGNNIFASSGSGSGIFLSTDKGSNWTAVSNGMATSLAVIGNNVFASTNGGIYISTNNGIKWTSINNGLTATTGGALQVCGSNLFVISNDSVFLSTNNGSSWTQANNGLAGVYIRSLTAIGATIFAGTMGNGIFRSTNNGANWEQVNKGSNILDVISLTVSENNIIAGSDSGRVFLSSNEGNNWTQMNIGLTNRNVNAVAAYGTNIFAGTQSGIFLTSDNGLNWEPIGLPNTFVWALAAKGNNIYAAADYDGLFKSTNNGDQWSSLDSREISFASSICTNGSDIYAGASYGIYISTNDGLNWRKSTPYSSVNSGRALYSTGDTVFANFSEYSLYRSYNKGIDWVSVGTGFSYGSSINSIVGNGNCIYAGTSNLFGGDGVFLSTNNGTNWNKINNGLTNTSINMLTFSGSKIFAGTSSGVFISTNSGIDWVQAGLSNIGIVSLISNGNNLFAGTYSEGVFFSSDLGANWTMVGLKDNVINSLVVANEILFAATDSSCVWRRPISELTSVHNDVNYLPNRFTLEQNYPNPFNPNTIISYSLLSASKIKLIIYNTLGQTIKVMENGFKSAGKYSSNFNATNLPSGIYFYRLEAAQFTQVKKMILIK